MQYNKLVRDRIPAIVTNAGQTAVTRVMDDFEYRQALLIKLVEEVGEFTKERSLDELADILEVVYALAEAEGASKEELEFRRAEKARSRGGFAERVFLIETKEKKSTSW